MDQAYDPDPFPRWHECLQLFGLATRSAAGPLRGMELADATEVVLSCARAAGLDAIPFQRLLRHLRDLRFLGGGRHETPDLTKRLVPVVDELAAQAAAKQRDGNTTTTTTLTYLARSMLMEAKSLVRFRDDHGAHPVWVNLTRSRQDWVRLREQAQQPPHELRPQGPALGADEVAVADVPAMSDAAQEGLNQLESEIAADWERRCVESLKAVRAEFGREYRRAGGSTGTPEARCAKYGPWTGGSAVHVALQVSDAVIAGDRDADRSVGLPKFEWPRLEVDVCAEIDGLRRSEPIRTSAPTRSRPKRRDVEDSDLLGQQDRKRRRRIAFLQVLPQPSPGAVLRALCEFGLDDPKPSSISNDLGDLRKGGAIHPMRLNERRRATTC